MASFLISSGSSVDRGPVRCSGGHGFDSCWGFFSLSHARVIVDYFIFHKKYECYLWIWYRQKKNTHTLPFTIGIFLLSHSLWLFLSHLNYTLHLLELTIDAVQGGKGAVPDTWFELKIAWYMEQLKSGHNLWITRPVWCVICVFLGPWFLLKILVKNGTKFCIYISV